MVKDRWHANEWDEARAGSAPDVNPDVGERMAALGTDVGPSEAEVLGQVEEATGVEFRFVTTDGERHPVEDGRIEIDGEAIRIVPEELTEARASDAEAELEGMEEAGASWVEENLDEIEETAEAAAEAKEERDDVSFGI